MTFKRRFLAASFVAIPAVMTLVLVFDKPRAETAADPDVLQAVSTPARSLKPDETPIPVKAVEIRRDELVVRLRSPAEAVAERQAVLKTEVAGVVKALQAREGFQVKAGELLATLDDRAYRLALERQEATRLRLLSEMLLEKRFGRSTEASETEPGKIDQAKSDLAEVESKFHEGLISKEGLEKAVKVYETALIESGLRKDDVMAASKGLTQAEVDVRTAELDLEKTIIRAPFAGIITGINVSPGEHAAPGRDLLTIVDIGAIKVIARVLESEVGKVRAGRAADLRFSAYPDRVFRGVVEAVSPVINPEDRTCAVRVAVENPGEEIKPGMHAEVEIAAEVHAERLLVPREAVLVRGGRKLVFVVEEGLAKWRAIEVGLENESFAEVLDGVKEGDMVIVEGHFTLAHDARVSVTN
jgi:RND family efflux transporter MFP subunit